MVELLGEVSPDKINESDVMGLRGCGLSLRKAEYILGIAKMWEDGFLDVDCILGGV